MCDGICFDICNFDLFFLFVWRFSPNPSDPDFNQPTIRYFRHLDILWIILGFHLLFFTLIFFFIHFLPHSDIPYFWAMSIWALSLRHFVIGNTKNTQGARPTTKSWSDLHNIGGVKEQSIPRTSDVINYSNILVSNHPTIQISKYCSSCESIV